MVEQELRASGFCPDLQLHSVRSLGIKEIILLDFSGAVICGLDDAFRR